MKKNSKSSKTQEEFKGEVKINFPKPDVRFYPDYSFEEVDHFVTSTTVTNPELPTFPKYKLITVDVDGSFNFTFSNDLAYLLNIYKVTCDFVGIYVKRNENAIFHTLKIF